MNNTPNETEAKHKPTFSEWFSNFWYHYKWHSIVAVFLVITITICTLQMCTKEEYDEFIMYAGGYEIDRKSDTGGTPEYQTVLSSLTYAIKDYDKNGKTSINLYDLFILTNDEIKNMEFEDGYEPNYPLISENLEIFRQNVSMSDYYVCLLSKAMYDEFSTISGVEVFAPLAPYVNEGTTVEYYTDCAVYLSSTGFSSMPGISDFPEDTLICLRKVNAVSAHLDKRGSEKKFKKAEETVESILNFAPIG